MTTPPILASRIDTHGKTGGLLLAVSLLAASGASAATLLSSAEQVVPAFQPASAGLFAPAQGRQGPIAQPSGQTFAATTAAAAPPVEREEPARPVVRKKKTTTPVKKRRVVVETTEPEPEPEPATERAVTTTETPEAEIDYKTPAAMATTAKNFLNVEFGWGWYNEYYFRGVNILKSVSSERTTNGVFTTHAVLAYIRPQDAFTFGFNYWQAMGRQQPKGGEFNVPPNKGDKRINGAKVGQKFSLPSRDRYAEYNFNLAYTRTLIEGKLTGTVGFNRYQFSNGEFYKTGDGRAITYADESVVKLTYTGLKYITPSVSWAHDFDGFEGDFFELRVDGNFSLPSQGNITAAIRPYTSLSYDMDYNGANNGLNSVEIGADLPLQLTNNLTLTFSANYVQALEASEGERRATTGFWGGVSLSASWGGPKIDTSLDKASKKVLIPEDKPHPWEIALGASYHQVNYDFKHGRISPFRVGRLYDERSGIADTNFARPGLGATYDDGVVSARQGNLPGTAPAVLTSQSQITGFLGSNAFVRFGTSFYGYGNDSVIDSSVSDDEDANVEPTVTLDREILRQGPWSVRAGLSYGFLNSSGDSGYRAGRIDTLIETQNRLGFDYALDNFTIASVGGVSGPRQTVIVDANAYANFLSTAVDDSTEAFLRTLRPTAEYQRTQAEVAKVVSFVRSSVDVNAHDLALPVSLRYDFGNRLHAEITLAPTLTLADVESKTEVSRRAVDDLANPQTAVLLRGTAPAFQRIVLGGGAPGFPTPNINFPPVATPQLPPPAPPQTPAPLNVAGGKGSTPEAPDFPGKDVGNERHSRSSLQALFGFKSQASLIFDLNDEKTIYAELYGGYHWVQELHVSNGFGEATIDLSGFQAGIGLGFRF